MKPIQFPKLIFVLAMGLLLLTVAGRELSVSDLFVGQNSEVNPSAGSGDGQIAQRIVGGKDAERSAWPWMAGLVSADDVSALDGQFCGGALVAPRWIMTAAHCLFDEDGRQLTASEIDVIVGRHQLSSSEGERIAVKAVILHPSYNNEGSEADLALLGLASASSQPPIALISSNTQATAGTMATALGWGQQGEEKAGTDVLHRVNVPIVDNKTCNAPESNDGSVSQDMLCAGFAEGGVDTCYGDSGGPLIVPNAKQNGWLQVGVVSWGDGCALPNKYGVYTRVANFNTWVQNEINTEPSASTAPAPSDESGNESENAGGNENEEDGDYDDDGVWYEEDGVWYEEDGVWYECEEGDDFCELDWEEEYYVPAGS